MNVDNLYKFVGDPGVYHVLMFFILICNWLPVNHSHLIMAFYGVTPPHRCSVPNETFLSNISLPHKSDASGNLTYDHCHVYWNLSSKSNETVSCPMGYEYDIEPGEKTVVTEWNLVCDWSYLKDLASSVYFVGVMIGGVLFGALADRFGRRPIVLFTLLAPIPVGVGLFFIHDFILFVILRFTQGMLYQGLQSASYVLLIELMPSKFRTVCGTAGTIVWSFGVMWLSLVCYLLKDWRYIQLVICVPYVLLVFQMWILPESPRWLLANQRLDEAKKIFIQAARFNKVQFPEDVFDNEMTSKVIEKKDGKSSQTYTVVDLVRTPRLRRRSLVAFFLWLSMSLGYYGLTFSLTDLSGNKYLNFFLGGVLELVAYLIVLVILLRIGRSKPLTFYLLWGGTFCIIAGCIPKETADGADIQMLSTVLALIGRFAVASCFCIMFLYTSELFPTVIRNLGVGSCAFWTRFGGVMAPLILQARHHTFKEMPIIIFGGFSLVSGFLSLLLPETLNQHIPDTIEEAESSYQQDFSENFREEIIVTNELEQDEAAL